MLTPDVGPACTVSGISCCGMQMTCLSQVGVILDKLEATGERQNTLIYFGSGPSPPFGQASRSSAIARQHDPAHTARTRVPTHPESTTPLAPPQLTSRTQITGRTERSSMRPDRAALPRCSLFQTPHRSSLTRAKPQHHAAPRHAYEGPRRRHGSVGFVCRRCSRGRHGGREGVPSTRRLRVWISCPRCTSPHTIDELAHTHRVILSQVWFRRSPLTLQGSRRRRYRSPRLGPRLPRWPLWPWLRPRHRPPMRRWRR